jgi:hypothetical protein
MLDFLWDHDVCMEINLSLVHVWARGFDVVYTLQDFGHRFDNEVLDFLQESSVACTTAAVRIGIDGCVIDADLKDNSGQGIATVLVEHRAQSR